MLSSLSRRLVPFLILILALCSISSVSAQDRLLPVFHFNRLTTDDGLPTSEIRSPVVCDRQGFIWVGTVNGLARYDGYTCKVYRNVPDDPHSISSNAIMNLYVDTRGLLWVGTFDTGISLYDAANDRFVNILPGQSDSAWLPHNPIVVFKEDRVGNIWIGSYQSSVVLADMSEAAHETEADSMAKRIQFRRFGVGESWDSIFWIDDWGDQTLLVASGRGIFTLDRVSHQISPLVLPPVVGVRLDTVKITDFCWQTPQKLWVATYAHGLYLLDRATGSLTGYQQSFVVPAGAGYWEKFGSAQTAAVGGDRLLKDTIAVQAGMEHDRVDFRTGRYRSGREHAAGIENIVLV